MKKKKEDVVMPGISKKIISLAELYNQLNFMVAIVSYGVKQALENVFV
jgi:hypothetical protein